LWTICLSWPQTAILFVSASRVARITGVNHQCPALFFALTFWMRKTQLCCRLFCNLGLFPHDWEHTWMYHIQEMHDVSIIGNNFYCLLAKILKQSLSHFLCGHYAYLLYINVMIHLPFVSLDFFLFPFFNLLFFISLQLPETQTDNLVYNPPYVCLYS
jgi:hypothetical protein